MRGVYSMITFHSTRAFFPLSKLRQLGQESVLLVLKRHEREQGMQGRMCWLHNAERLQSGGKSTDKLQRQTSLTNFTDKLYWQTLLTNFNDNLSSKISVEYIFVKITWSHETFTWHKINSNLMTHFLGKVPVASLISCFSENVTQ